MKKTKRIIKLKTKRAMRGKRNCVKKVEKSLRFLGVNSAGLKSKFTSFKKLIVDLRPSVFFVQETKFNEEGHIKIGDDYVIYELLRKNGKGGGGLALGCLKYLNPCLVSEGKDNVEAISVDIFIKNMKIRCCAAYGPQENDIIENKEAFWDHIDKEVDEAKRAGAGFILQFDGNLWAGDKIVPGDPRPQNKNGKYFEQFLNRNPHLSVVNSLPQCEGLITRSRLKDGVVEESVLDFFVVCSSVLPFVTKMMIDDSKKHILTNYKAAKTTGKAVDSDHYTQYLDLSLKISKEPPLREEIFNFKDKKCQEDFKMNTSNTNNFTACFDGEKPLLEKINDWKKVLKTQCSKSFKKIRIQNKKMKPISKKISNLIDKRNYLEKNGCVCEELKKHVIKHTKKNPFQCKECGKTFLYNGRFKNHLRVHRGKQDESCSGCEKELTSINIAISEEEASENREKILKQFSYFSQNPENIQI